MAALLPGCLLAVAWSPASLSSGRGLRPEETGLCGRVEPTDSAWAPTPSSSCGATAGGIAGAGGLSFDLDHACKRRVRRGSDPIHNRC
ncbi:unnamed protein product [Spirodela intermedia]|uniref:Uncharacterized protein n=1 Tax=Spirodela intermedia TaxID=51605 RepID=A0ABN7EBG9_SPIIN|nr:unnamed protein product [Spirodela intermedia]